MALQNTGAISLGNIGTEFGDTKPHRISEFYRGAGLVGTSNTNVPTSGAIKWSNFYGATAIQVFTPVNNIQPAGSFAEGVDGNDCYIRLAEDGRSGTQSSTNGFGDNFQYTGYWGTPVEFGAGANYWVRATHATAFFPPTLGDPLDVWLRLNVDRKWGVETTVQQNGEYNSYDTYIIIQIASDSAGSNVIYTTNALYISAAARNE